MNETAFTEFLDGIPKVGETDSGKFHDDLVGMLVQRNAQIFCAYWSKYPQGYTRFLARLTEQMGENWDSCYQQYLEKKH